MKPRYELLLLDADGTVLDFDRAQRFAVTQAMACMKLPPREGVVELYDSINDAYWKALERGEVTKEELQTRRFADLLREMGEQGDPEEFNRQYILQLGEADFVLEGAKEACAAIAPHCTIAIATNGILRAQKRRIEKSPLAPYITHLIVSEEAGAAKPEKQFYDYALTKCGVTDKSKVLMAGDSLGADMKGGVDNGLDTCWYNPGRMPKPDMPITYEISKIGDLVPIVLGK